MIAATQAASEPDLSAIRIVLVETSHPGNIGAAARAMKTMGLSSLALVNPSRYPSAEATARAAGADDVLYQARVFTSLREAIDGCTWVVATTARRRTHEWPILTPRAWAQQAVGEVCHGPIALVFGREKSGLRNEELDRCSAAVNIPVNPVYSSLNLAAAVQVLAYEARLALQLAAPAVADTQVPITPAQAEALYAHAEKVLIGVEFFDPDRPKQLPRRLRRMLARLRPDYAEYQIMRGVLSAVERMIGR